MSWRDPIDNARLGMLLFIAGESMFFAGLIGAFIVFQTGEPPGASPVSRGPSLVWTSALTVVGVTSVFCLRLASRNIRIENRRSAFIWLLITLTLGLIFLLGTPGPMQIITLFDAPSPTGAGQSLAAVLFEAHRLHNLAGVVWLSWATVVSMRQTQSENWPRYFRILRMYWLFVVVVWIGIWGMIHAV